jgi:hypothetical protein
LASTMSTSVKGVRSPARGPPSNTQRDSSGARIHPVQEPSQKGTFQVSPLPRANAPFPELTSISDFRETSLSYSWLRIRICHETGSWQTKSCSVSCRLVSCVISRGLLKSSELTKSVARRRLAERALQQTEIELSRATTVWRYGDPADLGNDGGRSRASRRSRKAGAVSHEGSDSHRSVAPGGCDRSDGVAFPASARTYPRATEGGGLTGDVVPRARIVMRYP